MTEEELMIERIESYVKGEMSPEARAAFEQELLVNHQLRSLFSDHSFFLDGITGMKAQAFAERLKQIPPQKQLQQRLFNSRRFSIAAGILLMMAVAYFIWEPYSTRHIAREYYETPFAQIRRANAPQADSLYERGMQAFGNKDWKRAIEFFTRIESDHQFYVRSRYYLAHAYAGQKNYREALALFGIPDMQAGQYAEQSEWNAVLMKLFLEYPKEEISADLQKIVSNRDHFYRTKAEQLMIIEDL